MLNKRTSQSRPGALSRRPEALGSHFEPLEGRRLLAAYSWTADEVYLLELVNRARFDPMAEGARLGVDLTQSLTAEEIAKLVSMEPLAFNSSLTDAARLHSQDMGIRGFFAHVNPDNLDPTARAQGAGYDGSAGENIAAGYDSVDTAHLEWLKSVGHRRNVFSLHTDFDSSFYYSEFGAGMYFQSVEPDDNTRYTSYYSQEFGIQAGDPPAYYLLGVVFDDNNANNFYTPGEGRAHVRVDVFTDLEEAAVGSYTTDAAGNYQIPLDPGTYTVVFTNVINGLSTSQQVTIGSSNVKLDARGNQLNTRILSDNFSGTNSIASGSADGADVLTVTTIDRFGSAIAFRQTGGQWVVADLNLTTGIDRPTGQLVTWTDPATGFAHAAAPSPGGLLIFVNDPGTGVWSAYNLTNLIAGSQVVTSELTVFHDDVSDQVIVAGLAANGDMVIYTKPDASGTWNFYNLTIGQIVANGQSMPALTGSLVSYATAWGGLNIAGLDSAGDIHAVWWSPGMPAWRVDNISDVTGAPAMTGGLTVFQTPWGSINLAGIDVNGKVQDTWWVPGMPNWVTTNFNEAFGGPTLLASSLTSFVMPWGGLNLVGVDAGGKVWFYWWTPGLDSWQVTDVSGSIGGAPVSGTLRGVSSSVGTTSLLGKTAEGHVLRYWWAPGRANWEVQDLTDLT